MSVVPLIIVNEKKDKLMKLHKNPSKRYTLFIYTLNGEQVISAIHQLDIFKFLAENPDAKVYKR